jgi:hypothetical protein
MQHPAATNNPAAATNNRMIERFDLIPISGPMFNVSIDWDLPYD